jgi:hypothetical protein
VLVDNLPRESATVRAMFGEDARWGDPEYLLAQAVDYLQALTIQMSGKKSNRFRPLPRPGQKAREKFGGKRAYTVEELRRLRARRAEEGA